MTGGAYPVILDRIHEELAERGEPLDLKELTSRYLCTDSIELGKKIVLPLIEQDPRFRLLDDKILLNRSDQPDVSRKLEEVEFAVLDFETSGLSPVDRAIEIGISIFRDGREIDFYESLINPGIAISNFVTGLTGIKPQDLEGKPSFGQIWPEVRTLISGRVLVAHNLPFDSRILKRELDYMGVRMPSLAGSLCSLKLARRLLPKEESKSLDSLAYRFGFSFDARHRAMDDARMAGRVMYRLFDIAYDRYHSTTYPELSEFLS